MQESIPRRSQRSYAAIAFMQGGKVKLPPVTDAWTVTTLKGRLKMAKVWCAAIECANNKNNLCKAAEINLSDGHIHTVHQGYKQIWECKAYNMSERSKQLEDALKQYLKMDGERKVEDG